MKPDLKKIAEWVGVEVYIDHKGQELWVTNVPYWPSHMAVQYDPRTNDAQAFKLLDKLFKLAKAVEFDYISFLGPIVSAINEGQTLNEAIVNAVWAKIQGEG